MGRKSQDSIWTNGEMKILQRIQHLKQNLTLTLSLLSCVLFQQDPTGYDDGPELKWDQSFSLDALKTFSDKVNSQELELLNGNLWKSWYEPSRDWRASFNKPKPKYEGEVLRRSICSDTLSEALSQDISLAIVSDDAVASLILSISTYHQVLFPPNLLTLDSVLLVFPSLSIYPTPSTSMQRRFFRRTLSVLLSIQNGRGLETERLITDTTSGRKEGIFSNSWSVESSDLEST